MHWKTILAVILIIGIAVFLFTPYAQKLMGFRLDLSSLTGMVNNIISSFSSLLTPFPTGNYFSFVLTATSEPLYKQSFNMENAILKISGIYIDNLIVGNSIYQTQGKTGKIEINGFKGKIEVSISRSIKISGEASEIKLEDSISVKPSDKTFSVRFEISPIEYFIAPIIRDKLILTGLDGKIERIDIFATQELKNETLEITGFIGNIRLSGEYSITGSAIKIKGSTFVWTG